MATTIVNTYTSFPATGSVGGWVEVGRTTLACAGDTITVSCLADKRYYMVLTDIIPCGNVREIMRVNSAAGTSYSHRDSANGAADAIKTSRCSLEFGKNSEATTAFSVGYWSNLSSHENTCVYVDNKLNICNKKSFNNINGIFSTNVSPPFAYSVAFKIKSTD